MTTRTVLFDSPFLLGFDHTRALIDRAAKAAHEGYPPYNVEQRGDRDVRITLAVAGFAMEDLQITQEDNQLVIRGRQKDDSEGRIFLHRGIAARAFQRSFVLADGVEVGAARLENGLLSISLQRRQLQSVVQTIPISRK